MPIYEEPPSVLEGQSFRAGLGKSAAYFFASSIIAVWCLIALLNLKMDILPLSLVVFLCGISTLIMVLMAYRMIWRPVMIHVDKSGIYLKSFDALIPWKALQGARLTTVQLQKSGTGRGKQLVELVPADPLHASLKSQSLQSSRSVNHMIGLPDYCISMDTIDGSNAMLLAALSFHVKILPHVRADV